MGFREERQTVPAIVEVLPRPVRLSPVPRPSVHPEHVVAAYRTQTEQLLAELGSAPSPLALNRCLLFLTIKYREARRLAPEEGEALAALWDEACGKVEFLAFSRVSPPPLEPPPAPVKSPRKAKATAERQPSLLDLLLGEPGS